MKSIHSDDTALPTIVRCTRRGKLQNPGGSGDDESEPDKRHQRGANANKITQTHIRGVWDTQRYNSNPLCTGHPSCLRGTWVYYRID